jgi:hypothetical protein
VAGDPCYFYLSLSDSLEKSLDDDLIVFEEENRPLCGSSAIEETADVGLGAKKDFEAS